MIRSGYHAELDEFRNLSQHSKQIIAAMEERERKRTNINSLKIRFNQIFGYYIEISRPICTLLPRTTSANKRWSTPSGLLLQS